MAPVKAKENRLNLFDFGDEELLLCGFLIMGSKPLRDFVSVP